MPQKESTKPIAKKLLDEITRKAKALDPPMSLYELLWLRESYWDLKENRRGRAALGTAKELAERFKITRAKMDALTKDLREGRPQKRTETRDKAGLDRTAMYLILAYAAI